MPEGDTIHKLARKLAPVLAAQPVREAWSRSRGELRDLIGRAGEPPSARGKHLIIGFQEWSLRVHLGIGGRCRLIDPNKAWRGGQVSLALVLPAKAVMFFKAPRVDLLRTAHLEVASGLRTLGPDLCTADADLGEVQRRARARGNRRRAIGELLMDQRVAAGIGNVFRSEVLFICRVAPETPVAEVDDTTLAALVERAHALLQLNLGDGPRVTRPERRAGEPDRWVYGRLREPCLVCRAPITSLRQGAQARIVYRCPRCQPHPGPGHTGASMS